LGSAVKAETAGLWRAVIHWSMAARSNMPVVGSGAGKPRIRSAGSLAENAASVRCRRRAAFSAGTSRAGHLPQPNQHGKRLLWDKVALDRHLDKLEIHRLEALPTGDLVTEPFDAQAQVGGGYLLRIAADVGPVLLKPF
jgi:hypothetical protein